MKGRVAWGQTQGRREAQEDCARCLRWKGGSHLMLLADGIGGAVRGDIASSTAVDAFRGSFINSPDLQPRTRLLMALQHANDAVYDRVQERLELRGMGTTLTAAAVVKRDLYWVSVGDSPMWLFRGGSIRRLNEDHSVGGVLDRRAENGEITPTEALASTGREELLEAVTGDQIRLVDAPREPLRLVRGDTVMLASDGVQTCSDDELVQIVTRGRLTPADLVETVLAAIERHASPAQDNATLIVFRMARGTLARRIGIR